MSTEMMLNPTGIGVLIVDDDTALRRMVTMALEDAAWDVLEAQDGPEALAILRSNVNHLVVLLDGKLPKMSGEDVLVAVQADPQLKARHAYVLISGNTATHSRQLTDLLRELSVSVIAKPFSIDELLSVVEIQARRLLVAEAEQAG